MKRIPVGVDDFKKLREQDFYYVDKTLFIKELRFFCALWGTFAEKSGNGGKGTLDEPDGDDQLL